MGRREGLEDMNNTSAGKGLKRGACWLVEGAAGSAFEKKESSAKITCRFRCPLWGLRLRTPCTVSLQLFGKSFSRSKTALEPKL